MNWSVPSLLLLLLVSASAVADKAVTDEKADAKAIRARVDSYVATFNRGDAKALAAHWSEDAVYVTLTTGERITGRKALEAEFQSLFADSDGLQLRVTVNSLRFITPGVAIEDGSATFITPGELPSKSNYTAIHVKEKGKWLLDSVRETVLPTKDSHFEYLKDLEWMIGEWVDQDKNSTIETKCQWTKNRNFMTRSFKVFIKDRVDLAGTQVIGWDPVNEQIRSWVFDTNGAFGEGTWTRKGNRYFVKAAGTLPGGKKASAINIITRVDDNTFTWQSIGREVDGEILPNVDPVTVIRK